MKAIKAAVQPLSTLGGRMSDENAFPGVNSR